MIVLVFTEHAMAHCFLPSKSHKLLLCLMHSNILNATASLIFFSTEEYLPLAMEIAPNVTESQQSKIPKVLMSLTILQCTDEHVVKLGVCSRSRKKGIAGEQKPVQDGDCAAEGFLELLP